VALVQTQNACLKPAARGSLKIQDAKMTQKSPSGHHRTTLSGYIFGNKAYVDHRKKLVNILRSVFLARTPQVEARSPDCRSNVENAPRRRPVAGGPAASASCMRRAVLGARPDAHRSPAGGARRPHPAGRSHYVVISRDGRKLVNRVRVMLP